MTSYNNTVAQLSAAVLQNENEFKLILILLLLLKLRSLWNY